MDHNEDKLFILTSTEKENYDIEEEFKTKLNKFENKTIILEKYVSYFEHCDKYKILLGKCLRYICASYFLRNCDYIFKF